MAGPWEQYQSNDGPWAKYGDSKKPVSNDPSDQIPGSTRFDKASGKWIFNETGKEVPSSANVNKPSGEWERTLDAAASGAMAVPMVGGAAGLGLKALGKAPLIAEEASTAAKYARPVLEAMKPNNLRELVGMGAAGAAAGAGGEYARSKAQEAGAGEFGQRMAEFGGGMATGIPSLATGFAGRLAKNVPTKMLSSAFETPFAKQGAELSKSTGIPLTPGQESGSKALLLGESAARQSFFTADKVLKADQEQAAAAINAVKGIADKISVQDLSKAGVGERLQDAITTSVKRLDELRDKQAGLDYGAVRQLAGGKPIISYKNTVDELKKMISENEGVVSGDSKKIAAQARAMLDQLVETKAAQPTSPILGPNGQPLNAIPTPPKNTPRMADVEEARKNRSAWGRAARGGGNIFDEVSPDANRTVAARLARAVSQDFEDASQGQTKIAEALKKANKNFADYSKSIEYIQASALGKLVGKDIADAAVTGATGNTIAGEKVAQRFLSMTPSEAKQVSNILNVNNPQVLSEAKSYLLRDSLKKSLDVPISSGANSVPMSYHKFIKSMPDKEYLSAVGFTPKELKEITDVMEAMRRSGDRSGANVSGTTPMKEFFNMVDALTGGVKKIASTAAQATVMRGVAKAMTEPNGREALLALSKFDPKKQQTKEIRRAIQTLISYQGDKEQ